MAAGLAWISLAAWLVLTIAGLVYAVVRGLRAYRDFKRSGGRIGAEVEGISRRTAEVEAHLRQAGESGERLKVAVERLNGSKAVLDTQLAAMREAKARVTLGRLFG